jgi:hypothetical protein
MAEGAVGAPRNERAAITPGAGGSSLLLTTIVASSDVYLEFTAFDNTIYGSYRLEWSGLDSNSSPAYLVAQISSDGGATWRTDCFNSMVAANYNNVSFVATGAAADTAFRTQGGSQGYGNKNTNGHLMIYSPGDASTKVAIQGQCQGELASNIVTSASFGCHSTANCVATAIRLFFCTSATNENVSGNVISGTARLFGIVS